MLLSPQQTVRHRGGLEDVTAFNVNGRIFSAARAVVIASMAVKLVALVKELAVADTFGRSDAMDAFLLAFLVPGLLVNLFSESMNQALIPTLVRVRAESGKGAAQKLLSSAMAATCGLLLSGSVFMALTAGWLFPRMLPHFSPTKLALTERLFYGLLPLVLLAAIASICTAVLNTLERFSVPALAPALSPLAVLAATWLLAGRYGIWALVYGCLCGGLAHAAWMAWMMRRHGYALRVYWHGWTQPTREVLRQYGTVMLSGLVASGGLLVDQGMAATLAAGSLATLVYGNRFVSVAMTLMAGAVATAITPYFSQLVAKSDWEACRRTVHRWVAITALLSIPVALAMMVGSHALIRFTFQHGVFRAADTAAVSPVQSMYALQLPFFVVSRVFYRYLLAVRRTSLILVCGILNLVLDVVLNVLCMRWYGVAGIALATSLWTISTFAFLGFWTYRLLWLAKRPTQERTAGV